MYASYGKWECDSVRPAQDLADATRLAQTVFYHPDYGFSCATPGSKILKDRKSDKRVTWLPNGYFV